MGLHKVKEWLNSPDAWVLGRCGDGRAVTSDSNFEDQDGGSTRSPAAVVVDMMLLFKSFCGQPARSSSVGLASLYSRVVASTLDQIADYFGQRPGDLRYVVFVADVQQNVTRMKSATQRHRSRQHAVHRGAAVSPYPDADRVVRITASPPDADYVVYDDGGVCAFDLARALQTRAVYRHVFDCLRRKLAAHKYTCVSRAQRAAFRDAAVVFEFEHDHTHVLPDVFVGADASPLAERPRGRPRRIPHLQRVTGASHWAPNLAEGELLAAVWARTASLQGLQAHVWTSDSDILPILLHATSLQGCSGRPASAAGEVIWRRWPNFKPGKGKIQCLRVHKFAGLVERNMGLATLLLMCVVGGNDFVEKGDFTDRLGGCKMVTAASRDKRVLKGLARDVVYDCKCSPQTQRQFRSFVRKLHMGVRAYKRASGGCKLPDFDCRDTLVREQLVFKLCRYWFPKWTQIDTDEPWRHHLLGDATAEAFPGGGPGPESRVLVPESPPTVSTKRVRAPPYVVMTSPVKGASVPASLASFRAPKRRKV